MSLAVRGDTEPENFTLDNIDDLQQARSFIEANSGLVWCVRIFSPNGLGSSYSQSGVELRRISFQWQVIRRNIGKVAAEQIVGLHGHELGATAEQVQKRLEDLSRAFTGEFVSAAEARP